jgi:hypothetical protein
LVAEALHTQCCAFVKHDVSWTDAYSGDDICLAFQQAACSSSNYSIEAPVAQEHAAVQGAGCSDHCVCTLCHILLLLLLLLLACSPLWGTPDCPPTIPELVLRCDVCIDVRLPAVLAALLDQAAAAAAAAAGSSSSEGQQAGLVSEQLPALLQQLLQMRCKELLKAFPSSIEQDDAWLQQQQQAGQSSEADWLMAAVVHYRRAKKQVLQDQASRTL